MCALSVLLGHSDAIRLQTCPLLVSDVQHLGEAALVAVTQLIIETVLVQDCVPTSDRVDMLAPMM